MSQRRHILRKIAARRQELLDRREAGVLAAIDRVIRDVWSGVLSAIATGGGKAITLARAAVAGLPVQLRTVVADALAGLHVYAYGSTAKDVVAAIPGPVKAKAMRRAVAQSAASAAAAPPPFVVPTVAETIGVVFPPMPAATVNAIVYAGKWEERIEAITKLAKPDDIAAAISRSFTQGTPPGKLARELRPMLQNVQSSVRRVVRTEAARVSQTARMQAYDGLGTLVIGFQIHAVRDSRTRPEHAKRDGTVYHKNPVGDQKGLDQMPRPPLEADGTVAHNCRCWLTPVLGPFSDEPGGVPGHTSDNLSPVTSGASEEF